MSCVFYSGERWIHRSRRFLTAIAKLDTWALRDAKYPITDRTGSSLREYIHGARENYSTGEWTEVLFDPSELAHKDLRDG